MSTQYFTAKTDQGAFAGRGRVDTLGRVYWTEKMNIDRLRENGMQVVVFEFSATPSTDVNCKSG
ncbi:hypothetical protein [Pseudorhodobacter sp.]|uniref:hypothetical protein n=1 Tax=Pseudorhodobacter sp. TaxID=1934400 RepID=UPI002649DA04|nr:hypothetical protein [Pseudorhodobacter sp.]MDN5788651.1 hypothetical protein [Pseudorhodobacter sp.]